MTPAARHRLARTLRALRVALDSAIAELEGEPRQRPGRPRVQLTEAEIERAREEIARREARW